MVRRAFTGGVLLATSAMAPLALLELTFALLVRGSGFDSAGQGLKFALLLCMLLFSAGAMLGLVEGIVTLGVSLLTKTLAKRRIAEPRWMALIYSFLALPAIAMVAARIFSGRQASQIPGKDIIALGIGLAGLVGAYALFRLIIATREQFRMRRWERREAVILGTALFALAVAIYWVDHAVLPRLYGWFHAALVVLVVATMQLAVGTFYVGFRPRARWLSRVMEPGVSGLIMVAAIASGAWAISSFGASQPLRFVAHEHTAAATRILSGATYLGLTPKAGGSAAPTKQVASPEPAPSLPEVQGPTAPRSSVLLITVDALRADQLAAYGEKGRVTPELDAWAKDAVVFQRGYCQIPHTSFSLASLMTGTYLQSERRAAPARKHRTLPRALRRYGYKTAAFFPPAVFYIDRDAFGAYEEQRFGFEYVKYQYSSAEKRVDQVLSFLQKQRGERVFIWVHFFEPHEPYVHHEGFGSDGGGWQRYRSEVSYVDRQAGRLIKAVRQASPRTIVALTSDHGEEFGDHGSHYHGNSLYEPQVRVPLVLSAPGVAGRKVAGPAQVIDLAPTILSLLELPIPAGMRGTDLGPWLGGQSPSTLPPAFIELRQKRAVIQGNHKLICDLGAGFCELYDLAADPGERHNLAGRQQARAAGLRSRLDRWLASHVPARQDETDDEESLALLDRGNMGDVTAIKGLARMSEAEGELGRRAVQVLASMHSPAARQALVLASKSRDPGVAVQACVGAAQVGDPNCLGTLPGHLSRPDLPPAMRRSALLAQAHAGLRSATLELIQTLESEDDLYGRLDIIRALGRLGDPAAAAVLIKQLGPLRTRYHAVVALGRIRARSAVSALGKLLPSDRFVSLRRAAARALGSIGDRRAVAALRKAVDREQERHVVADAMAALVLLGATPGPGVKALPATDWDCAGKRCTLTLEADGACARGAGRELLVTLTSSVLEKVLSHTVRAESPGPTLKSQRSTGRLDIRCGDTPVAQVDLNRTGALAVPLPADATGALTLTYKGDPPEVGYVGVRKAPEKAPVFE